MQQVDNTNVFVKYLPADVDDTRLRTLFSSFGTVVSAKVMVDVQNGTSLGYGFVRFSATEEAKIAIGAMSGKKVANKVLLCKLSNFAMYSDPSTNIYIKPLLPFTTEDDLMELFVPFGTVKTVKVMRDKRTGESKRIGFVRFEHQESATAAVEKMNGFKINSNDHALIVKYAESDHQRATRKAGFSPLPSQCSTYCPCHEIPSPSSPTCSSTTYYNTENAYMTYPQSCYYVPYPTSLSWQYPTGMMIPVATTYYY